MRDILLIDNGSTQPNATLSLRAIAASLAEHIGEPVHPLSLLHSDRIPADALAGHAAETLEPFLRRRLTAGVRDLVILPLFFGPSRALTDFIPERLAPLRDAFGPFEARIARALCPLPEGEPALVEILLEQVRQTAAQERIVPSRVILVDHGSPLPAVTEVRHWLGARLAERLGGAITLDEAVMERRPGAEYDFNGALLQTRLSDMAKADPASPVILAMLFLSPGRMPDPMGTSPRSAERSSKTTPASAYTHRPWSAATRH